MHDKLSRVDLNLLVAFEVLFQEKSTSRAAERLFVTQPAMSRTLSRLRDLFDDELFTRSPHGLVPSPKAEALADQISVLLEAAQTAIFPTSFDPGSVKAELRLGIQDSFASTIVPKFLKSMRAEAPNVICQIHGIPEDYDRLLNRGMLDFCIDQSVQSSDVTSKQIGQFYPICLMRHDHPLADADFINEDMFLSADRIFYTAPHITYEQVTRLLEKSRQRNNKESWLFETTELLVAIEMLLQSDAMMIAVAGTKNLSICQGRLIEKSIEGMDLKKSVLYLYLIQHKRTLRSPLHKWIADKLSRIVKSVFPLE